MKEMVKVNTLTTRILLLIVTLLFVMNVWNVKEIRKLQEANIENSVKFVAVQENLKRVQIELDILTDTKVSYSDMKEFDELVDHLNEIIGTYEVIK